MVAVDAHRIIEGEGTSALVWQQWIAASWCPELRLADLLDGSQRLVVVAPHPDDEVLACGGLMAMHAARGGQVVVVAVTDGEGSHAGLTTICPVVLAARRRRERLCGLVELGVAQPSVVALGLNDGGVQAQRMMLRGWLMFFLRPGDVVVSTWEQDGHPDHDSTGRVTRETCAGVGCKYLAAPVWMWHWAKTQDHRVPWSQLQRLELGDDMWSRKQAALSVHVTQLTPRSATVGAVLGEELLARAAWRHEFYFV